MLPKIGSIRKRKKPQSSHERQINKQPNQNPDRKEKKNTLIAIGMGSGQMASFGKKIRECRETKGISQNELAKLIEAHHSIIGKYERDEVKPSIDVVKKLATVLDTTVGYLLGETADQVLKDPSMLKRLNDIMAFPKDEQDHIIYTIDAMIKAAKINAL